MRRLLALLSLVLWSWSVTAQVRFAVYYNDLAALVAASVPGGAADIQRVAVVKYTGVTGDIDTGGVYYYDPASVLAVNSPLVLKPTNANGRWIRGNAPGGNSGGLTGTPAWINVTDPLYGANATDAVADDVAILAAKAVAYTKSGSVLYFPVGTYYVTNTATLTFTNKVKLFGDSGVDYNNQGGTGTKIIKTAGVSGPLVCFTNITARGSSIEGIKLEGVVGNTGDGIVIATSHALIRDVSVELMGQDGIRVGTINAVDNCNIWMIDRVAVSLNVRHGVYLSSAGFNANGGASTLVSALNNGGDGFRIGDAWLNDIGGLVLENNTGFGLKIESGGRDNLIRVADSESNVAGQFSNDANGYFNDIQAPNDVMINFVDDTEESQKRLIGKLIVGNGPTNNWVLKGRGDGSYVANKFSVGVTNGTPQFQLEVKDDMRVSGGTNNIGRLLISGLGHDYQFGTLVGGDPTFGLADNTIVRLQLNTNGNMAILQKLVIGFTDPDAGSPYHLRVFGDAQINSNLLVVGNLSANLNASDLVSGTVAEARLATLNYAKVTAGQNSAFLTNDNLFLAASVKELQGFSRSTTYSWDLDGNRSQFLELTNNTTVSFANVPTSTNVAEFFSLSVTNTGSFTLTFTEPANGRWPAGEPVIGAGAKLLVTAFWDGYELVLSSSSDGLTLSHFNTNQFTTNSGTWPIALKADFTATNITFPATQTASTGTNTLDDYEEGPWTPADGSGAGLALTVAGGSCHYVKVGKLITANFMVTYPATADGLGANISGLPYTSSSSDGQGGFVSYTDSGLTITFAVGATSTAFSLYKTTGGGVANSEMSAKGLRGTVIYMVTQ